MTPDHAAIVREALEFAARMLTGDRDTFDAALAALDALVAELATEKDERARLVATLNTTYLAALDLRDEAEKALAGLIAWADGDELHKDDFGESEWRQARAALAVLRATTGSSE